MPRASQLTRVVTCATFIFVASILACFVPVPVSGAITSDAVGTRNYSGTFAGEVLVVRWEFYNSAGNTITSGYVLDFSVSMVARRVYGAGPTGKTEISKTLVSVASGTVQSIGNNVTVFATPYLDVIGRDIPTINFVFSFHTGAHDDTFVATWINGPAVITLVAVIGVIGGGIFGSYFAYRYVKKWRETREYCQFETSWDDPRCQKLRAKESENEE